MCGCVMVRRCVRVGVYLNFSRRKLSSVCMVSRSNCARFLSAVSAANSRSRVAFSSSHLGFAFALVLSVLLLALVARGVLERRN